MVVQNFLDQLLKKKVHPITGRSRGPLLNEEEPSDAPEAVDLAGDDPPTEDSQESGESPTNDDGIESNGSDASDQISGEDGRDDIDGGLGADLIDAGNGSDEVDGGKGDDSLDGGQGDDTLIGGLGDDTFAGGEGADLFDLSLGSDVIQDFNPEDGDRIILPDGQEFDLFQDGDDLVILLDDGSSRVLEGLSREEFEQKLQELIVSLEAIQPVETEIVLTDGDDQFSLEEATDESLVIDALAGNDNVEASDGDDTLDGGDGDDTLIGGAGADRLLGRQGDDVLIGGEGGDTYVLTRGNDTIEGFSLDQDRLLVRKGQKYASEEIDDERGKGLLINLFEDDENPKTDDPKSSTLILGIGKGEIQAHNILIKSGDLEVPYSESGDIKGVIKGSNDSDYERVAENGEIEESGKGRLIGTKRDDVIAGRGGNDQLSGDKGDDILEGGEGVDTLLGGRGDDWLSGGGDGDVYIISRGNDTIDGFNKERDRVALLIGQEYETENTNQGLLVHLVDPDDDTIEHTTLFAGIQEGELTAENLLYINRAGRLVTQAALTVDEEGRLIIEGTENADTINAQTSFDTFEPKSSDDNVAGESLIPQGANIRSYQGSDTIIGTAGSDRIKPDGTKEGGIAANKDNNVSAGDGNDQIILSNTNWEFATVDGGYGIDTVINDGKDNIRLNGINFIKTGEGNDKNFVFSTNELPSIDPEQSSLQNIEEITFEGGHWALVGNKYNNAFDLSSVTLERVNSVNLYGGNDYLKASNRLVDVIWKDSGIGSEFFYSGGDGNDTLIGNDLPDTIKGDAGNDQLKGGSGNDELNGGGDNDFLYGQGGDDTLRGHTGNDLLNNGNGNSKEILNGGDGNDTFLIQAWDNKFIPAETAALMAEETLIIDFEDADHIQLPIEYGYSDKYLASALANGKINFQGNGWGFTIKARKEGANVSELLMNNPIERVAYDNRNTLVAKEYLGSLGSVNTSGQFDWTSDTAGGYEHTDGETYRNNLILMGGHDIVRGFNGTIDRIVKNGFVLQSISDELINIADIDGNEERHIVINYKTPIEDDAERTLTLIDPILTVEQEDLLPSDQLLAVTDLESTTPQQDVVSGFPIDPLIVPEQSLNPVKNADEYQYSVNENVVSIQGLDVSEDIRAIANDNPYAFYYDALLNPVGTPKNFELFGLPAYSINGGVGEDVIYGSTQNDTIDGGSQKDAIFALKGEDIIKVKGDQGVNDAIWGGDGFKDVLKRKNNGKPLKDSEGQDVYIKTPEVDILLNAAQDDQHLQLNGVVSNVITMNADNPLFDFNGKDETDGKGTKDVKVEPNVNGIELIDLSEQDNPRKLLGTDKGNYFDLRGTSLLNLFSANEALGQVAAANEASAPYSVFLDDGDDLMYASSLINDNQSDEKYSYQGWSGNDTLYGGKLGDALFGGDHNDKLFGQGGNDEIDGESGDDRIHGHGGNDFLIGGDGHDFLYGSGGDDHLYGDGEDGTGGDDYLHGGAGDDEYFGGGGRDRFLIKTTKIDKDENSETFGLSIHNPEALGEQNKILDFNIQKDYLLIVEPNNRVPSSKGYRYVLDDEYPILLGGENVKYKASGAENLEWALDLVGDTQVLTRKAFGQSGRIIHVSPEKTSDRTKVLFYGMNEGGDKGDEIQVIYPDWNKVKTKDGRKAEVHGLDGDDILTGGAGLDSLFGENGADTLDGGGGDDFIVGGAQDDSIKGATGDDRLDGNDHNDTIFGNEGEDYLRGMGHNDSLNGGDGDDTLDGGSGVDTLIGGKGGDVFILSEGEENVIVDYVDGSDVLQGPVDLTPLWDSENHEVVEFTYGDDAKPSTVLTYNLGESADLHTTILYGIGTLPEISEPEIPEQPSVSVPGDGGGSQGGGDGGSEGGGEGGGSGEIISPDLGNPVDPEDQPEGDGSGGNNLPGEEGTDGGDSTIDSNPIDPNPDDGNQLRAVTVEENPDPESFDDFKRGDGSDQTIKGSSATDMLRGRNGNDRLVGKKGNDYLYGGGGNDTSLGGGSTDVLLGRKGADVLKGGNGNDLLYGGYQNDTLTGGEGQDVFLLSRELPGESDVITDFNVNQDGIGLTKAVDLIFSQEGDHLRITGLYGVNTLLQNVQKDDFLASFPDNLEIVPAAEVYVI